MNSIINMWSEKTPVGAETEMGDIQKFYKGKTILLTGGTGFLGKLILEKLLTSCDVSAIYCIIRMKKGKTYQERFDGIFHQALFEDMKENFPEYKSKVFLLPGDCIEENLGLSVEDRAKIVKNVDVIIHCAATVRFDEDLRTAFYINCRAVRILLQMAKEMPDIKAFVHVSTAFSNCVRKEVNEEFYDVHVTANQVENVLNLPDDVIEKMTPILLKGYPNTYVFTKNIAENIIRHESKGLPISVVRPSIILNTAKSPIPGWIDNFFGPIGLTIGICMGFLRVFNLHAEKFVDIVPADFVTNNILAVGWKTAGDKPNKIAKEEIPIYNYTCYAQNPITLGDMLKKMEISCRKLPSEKVVYHGTYVTTRNNFTLAILSFLLHTIPGVIVDFIRTCLGKKPMLLKAYRKMHTFRDVVSHFTTGEWYFKNGNVQNLWNVLSPKDKEVFFFDIDSIIWPEYFDITAKGARVYLLKDPLHTLPEGRKKYIKLQLIHYTLVTVVCLALLKGLMCIWNYVL